MIYYSSRTLDQCVEISYKNEKLKKECNTSKLAVKLYGDKVAEKLQLRIDQISSIESVDMMIQYHVGRCHALVGDRKNEYAVDLVAGLRLIFEKIDISGTSIRILEIKDYH